MSSAPDDTDPPDKTRLVMVILVALVAVGIVVGLVLSWAGTRALDAAGVDDTESQQPPLPSPETSPAQPPSTQSASEPTETPGGSDAATGTATAPTTSAPTQTTTEPTETTETTEPTETTKRSRKPPSPSADEGSLSASTTSAGSYEEVTLSGQLPGVPAGTTLQVERLEGGGWVSFPTTATTDADGSFSTYVQLGQPGANQMRVTVPGSTTTTPTVTITIS